MAAAFDVACAELGAALAPEGFRFARSGPRASRRAADFRFVVDFQASSQAPRLSLHAHVYSPRLAAWRSEVDAVSGPSDFVGGGQVGNLEPPPRWLEWDLSDSAAALTALRRLALPFFAAFEPLSSLTTRLAREDVAGFTPLQTFELLACFESLEVARASAVRFLASRPELRPDYRAALARLRQEGRPKTMPRNHAEALATLTVVHALAEL